MPVSGFWTQDSGSRAARTWVPQWVHCCPGAAVPMCFRTPPTIRRRFTAFSLTFAGRPPLRFSAARGRPAGHARTVFGHDRQWSPVASQLLGVEEGLCFLGAVGDAINANSALCGHR